MAINPLIFRGYDIRGVVDQDLSEEVYYTLGRSYGTILSQRRIGTCPVGRDNRLTSEKYSKSFIKGLNDSGINTIDLGLSLSQIVYFASYHFLTKGYAMITASHNSKKYNGLKLGIGYSESLSGNGIQELRQIAENSTFVNGSGKASRFNLFPIYQKFLTKQFKLKKSWKVVVDSCNSTSGIFYPSILSGAGCKVVRQNCNLDSNYPLGDPDPTDSKVIQRLSDRVLKEKADIGLAFDADGDRMAVVDELGKGHWMDIILGLFSQDILEKIPNSTIVYNSLCSKKIPQLIKKYNGIPIICKAGHSFVKDKMRETSALLGGELSGHIFFADNFFGHDDAAYAALRLLMFLENHNFSLAQATAQFENYISSPEIKLEVDDNLKFDLVSGPIKKDLLDSWPNATISDIDGIRIDTPDSMVIIRASQNGPYITVRFESNSDSSYQAVRDRVRLILSRRPEIKMTSGTNISTLSD